MAEDHSQEKFAADVAGIIMRFMKHITAVKNLGRILFIKSIGD